jgi:hypothetical protein
MLLDSVEVIQPWQYPGNIKNLGNKIQIPYQTDQQTTTIDKKKKKKNNDDPLKHKKTQPTKKNFAPNLETINNRYLDTGTTTRLSMD